MELIWAYLLVFLLAAIPFVEAIYLTPIAVVAGLSPIPTFVLAVLGNLLTVYIVILFIDKMKQWRKKKNEESGKSEKRQAKAERIWKKYGLPGLTIIGPFFIGSHLVAFLSLIFGGTKKKVTLWMTISIVGWSLLLTILAILGFEFMDVENPFIEQFFTKQ